MLISITVIRDGLVSWLLSVWPYFLVFCSVCMGRGQHNLLVYRDFIYMLFVIYEEFKTLFTNIRALWRQAMYP